MSAQLSGKVKPSFKRAVEDIASSIGLDVSDVLRVLLKKFVYRRGFPFDVVEEYDRNPTYNKKTLNAMKKTKNGGHGREVNIKEFENMLDNVR
jgi:addiction module RelB/DinJ family antitoxin